MMLPTWLDRAPYAAGTFIAGLRHWSPIGTSLVIRIDDCCDERLIGKPLSGVARAFDPEARGTPLLIQLRKQLTYADEGNRRYASFVVATAALRWHCPYRLLVAWTAVRIVDAASFADQTYRQTIGIGRLTLQ